MTAAARVDYRGPVAVAGTGVIGPCGRGQGGLAAHAQARGSQPNETQASRFIATIEPPVDAAETRARKLMSRPALLATLALKDLLRGCDITESGDGDQSGPVGLYMGVGASAGDVTELEAMLAVSIQDQAFSLRRFGEQGLRACNPLFAFQLMNNFTLCHPAIQQRLTGPNAAIFSRGAGTAFALLEGMAALRAGECRRAIVGGADSALHAVTLDELDRAGYLAAGLVPSEGAALLALQPVEAESPHVLIESVSVFPRVELESPPAGLDELARGCDALVLAPWGDPPRQWLERIASAIAPGVRVLDLNAGVGETLAAGPALAWVAALDLVERQGAARVLALGAGIDGDLTATLIARARDA